MEIEVMGRAVKITDIKAVQKGFLRPVQDTLIVELSTNSFPPAVGPLDYNFAVALPVWRYSKEEFLAKVTAEAKYVLEELIDIDTPEKKIVLRRTLEREKELNALVNEIKSKIGLAE